ncbi:hypothetical protein [Jannaschia donghaensis]|uniref:Uncharacterized protein n=1 Tax=Jannaschia donghaensis TaxID=420998 RepID=A0A0M6YNH3_9RHOB|nr:hypothetical protein [Jannaschia donghaensis]CTQ50787.1 hypothetical protein JDO7802_02816 [Jannaschia donghaensis]
MTHAVTRRRVLYIPGYDPFHPRRYRELYRKESLQQAELSGFEIAQTKGDSAYSWHVSAHIEGVDVETEIEVLVWSDIVSSSMAASIPATYAQLVRTAWTYIGSGALFRLMRLRQGPVIAALYPIVLLLLQLGVAVLAGWAVAALTVWGLRAIWPAGEVTATIVSIIFAVATLRACLRWFKTKDSKVFAYYLMHDYAFSARWNGANPPELERRMEEFADHIAEAFATEADEVLIVGHSSGAHLAISVLADMIRAGRIPERRCSLLTLGHVVPMVSFLPCASRLRGDLHVTGGQGIVPWVDVTAPGDGCAFALCDPVAVSGVEPPVRTGPLILSAAFTQTLTPQTWTALKRRYFRLHFQYLCAFDNLPGTPGDYDYFRVTAGPQRLATRFADRADSPSTKRTAVNRFTDMTP